MKAEKRSFRMHAQLLYSVIQRQAGTLSKAILEGVMNAVDAGAKTILLSVGPHEIHISDDGKGFSNRHEIEAFFETFGEPHDQSEHKVYGQFRMGRGQMFAFGANTWHTGEFEMVVDIKSKGLEYELQEKLVPYAGCHIDIDLYQELLPSDIEDTLRDIKRMVKYVPIPVTLNGEVVSKDPVKEKWDEITADAYVRFNKSGGGDLRIYNLGVFVCEYGAYRFGTGGEVVAKQQLKVNFARNDVQSDCEVWKRIKKVIDRRATKINKERTKLDDAGRQRFADQWRRGELEAHEFMQLKLFTDVTGRQWSWCNLANWSRCRGDTLCSVAPEGDSLGDKVMQTKLAFVFASETLERFDVSNVAALLNVIRYGDKDRLDRWKAVPFKTLERQLGRSYHIIPEKEYTARERAMLATIDHAGGMALREFPEPPKVRQIMLGTANARAWTDGQTYIALNRELLTPATLVELWATLGGVMLHEYCHDDPNTETHIHTPEFYQLFHDTRNFIGKFAEHAVNFFPGVLRRESRKLAKKDLQQRDKLAQAAKSLAALNVE